MTDTPRDSSPPTPKRILLIKPSSLGDVVHALPVLAGLRQAYPHAHIAWLIGSSFAGLLDGHPLIDEVIPFDRARYGKMWRNPAAALDFARFIASLRRRRFDLVIDLQGLIRSGLMAHFSGARRRVGFSDAREGAWLFYTRRVRPPAHAEHAVDKNLSILSAVGAPLPTTAAFPLGIRGADRAAARAVLERAAGRSLPTYIAVIPGARWESKRWPAERFAALLDRLHGEGLPPAVLLGGPDERALASEICRQARQPAIDLVGRTNLRELTALLESAACVVCCDSGPMHIAAAQARPIVALFGPTSARRTGPFSATASVICVPLDCAPCYKRICPLGHHRCMNDLTVQQVLARVREILRPAPDTLAESRPPVAATLM